MEITEEKFIFTILNRMTKFYDLKIDIIGKLIAIIISLVIVYQNDNLNIFILILVGIFSYIVTKLMYMLFFQGLSMSSTSYFILYKNAPTDFLMYLHFFTLICSIIISKLKFEFIQEGKILNLSFFDSYYYIISIVTTVGSNIYPNSNISKIFTMFLSIVTLLLVIFIFDKLSKKNTLKKEFVSSSQNHLRNAYRNFIELFNKQGLSEEKKIKLLIFFMEKFNFNTPDGYHKVYGDMVEKRYPIDL